MIEFTLPGLISVILCICIMMKSFAIPHPHTRPLLQWAKRMEGVPDVRIYTIFYFTFTVQRMAFSVTHSLRILYIPSHLLRTKETVMYWFKTENSETVKFRSEISPFLYQFETPVRASSNERTVVKFKIHWMQIRLWSLGLLPVRFWGIKNQVPRKYLHCII